MHVNPEAMVQPFYEGAILLACGLAGMVFVVLMVAFFGGPRRRG